jgi:hypothetical protein
LFAAASPLELCRAVAAPQAQITIRAHIPINRDFETSIETPKTKLTSQNQRLKTSQSKKPNRTLAL